ncbi:hypothetical protein SteCoe_33278 [Stentor coeruleus]|uniref:Cyclic nucleotide-binding domain-containing protein n=1 Tax=Stentor coeruleus TaxID=5963 RepID=A0A1R2AX80_9CILI|nr:hypothetical protein SteCoe_33278 [Stentor coeruleus]
MERVIKQIIKFLQVPDPDKNFTDLHDLIMSIPVFQRLLRNFTYASRGNLISQITAHEYFEGEEIYMYGDFCDAILILIQGSATLSAGHNDSVVLPIKMLNDPFISRSRIYPNNAIARERTFILKISLDLYNDVTLSELESNVKEKMRYVEKLLPGMQQCTIAQKEKIAYCMDIFVFPKGNLLCQEGVVSDKVLIVLDGECSILKNFGRKPRIISKLGKGSFLCENSILNSRPTDYTAIVSSDKAKVGKFKSSDVRSNFPPHILMQLQDFYSIKEEMHGKILKFPQLTPSSSLPSKFFPLASPRALSNFANYSLRATQNSTPTMLKPMYKRQLERLRDYSPLRIDKYF